MPYTKGLNQTITISAERYYELCEKALKYDAIKNILQEKCLDTDELIRLIKGFYLSE